MLRKLVLQTALGLCVAAAAVVAGVLYYPALSSSSLPALAELRGEGASRARARHVVVMVLDGARRADLETLTKTRPALRQLYERSARFSAVSSHPTMSRPMYATLGSGASPRLHGIATNDRRGPVRVDTVFAAARRAGVDVVLRDDRVSWWWDLFPGPAEERFERLADTIARLLQPTRAVAYVHVLDPDDAAHQYGASSPQYRDALGRAALAVERVAAALDPKRDALIVVADHGHRERGGHGGQEPDVVDIPLWISGPGGRVGDLDDASILDVAPTVAVLAGLPLPGASEGRPLFSALGLGVREAADLAERWVSQRWRLANAIAGALKAEMTPPPPPTQGGALAVPTAGTFVAGLARRTAATLDARDARETLWRGLGVAPLALLLCFLLWRRRVSLGPLALGLLPAALCYAGWAIAFPLSLSAVREKLEFYGFLALFASVAVDLAAALAYAIAKGKKAPRLLSDTGAATLVFAALEVAVCFALFGMGVGSALPGPLGCFIPALALTRLAVSAIVWWSIVPWLTRSKIRQARPRQRQGFP